MYGDASGKADKGLEEYVRSHPIRARILELYEEDEGRSLAVRDLQREMDGLPQSSMATIAYHLQVLRRTGLLPECAG
jgi:Helix-turn-helix domain